MAEVGSIWPLHPQPQPDELLSSWMIRLAHANRFKVHSFYSQFFGRERQVWTRDIDHFAPSWLLHGLSMRSGLSIERLERLTLRHLESTVFERFKVLFQNQKYMFGIFFDFNLTSEESSFAISYIFSKTSRSRNLVNINFLDVALSLIKLLIT